MSKPGCDKTLKLDQDWQRGKTFGESNMVMLQNDILMDVTFLVGKKKKRFKAHKYILCSRSSVFFSMFCNDETEYKDKEVIIESADPEIFALLLRHIYSDDVEITARTVTPLYSLAKRYALGTLSAKCLGVLTGDMTVDNVCSMLEQAHQNREPDIQKHYLSFIFKNALGVLKSSSFLDLCTNCLSRVIEPDDLQADESIVYEAVFKWTEKERKRHKLPANDDSRHRVLGNLKYLIRFPVMDIDYFTKYVSTQGLLTKDEKIRLFQYLHSRTSPNVAPFRSKRRSQTRALRFETTSGAWNVGTFFFDVIDFQSSRSITLDGIVVYGCFEDTAQYDVAVKVLDGKKTELAHVNTTLDTDSDIDMYDVILDESVHIEALTWYTIILSMEGPQTKRGVSGRSMVYCEKIQFLFKSSSIKRNCTTEKEGQIPGLLFHD